MLSRLAAPRIVGPTEGKAGSLGSISVRFIVPGEDTEGGFALVEQPADERDDPHRAVEIRDDRIRADDRAERDERDETQAANRRDGRERRRRRRLRPAPAPGGRRARVFRAVSAGPATR